MFSSNSHQTPFQFGSPSGQSPSHYGELVGLCKYGLRPVKRTASLAWSETHEVLTCHFHRPENLQRLEESVRQSNEKRMKIRPVESGLSLNGIGLARGGMVKFALMEKVLEVDKERNQVRVQAGIRVQGLVDAIKEHVLTMQSFASKRSSRLVALFRKMLSDNKHVKYQYIPYTDTIVVVTCNLVSKRKGPPKFKPKYSEDEALRYVRELYREALKKYWYVCCC